MPDAPSAIPQKRSPWRGRIITVVFVVVVGLGYLLIPPVWAPWIYFTGGSFHVAPWWSGAGSFEGPGGTYQVALSLSPLNTHSHPTLRTLLYGDGHLCTPSGERWILHIQGDMDKHLPLNTIGRSVDINSFSPNKPGTFTQLIAAGSPYVRLNGVWGPGKIDATGYLEYQPPAPGHPSPPKPAPITITLHEASNWWWPSCRAH